MMNFWKLSTFALTGSLLAVGIYATARPAHADPQPRMNAALQLLEGAKTHLEAANDDKGGHRIKAIQATKEAIEQVKKGIEYDNAHQSKDEKDKKK
jgi:hypothetical protein